MFPGRLGEFSEELDAVLATIGEGRAPDQARWLAGYHFNSALFRLSFAAERALKLRLGLPRTLTFGESIGEAEDRGAITHEEATQLHRLRNDINWVKHDPAEWRQRQIKTLDDAIQLVPLIVNLIQRAGSSGT
jgi:hypothetical protein